jgi:hypothetical protein
MTVEVVEGIDRGFAVLQVRPRDRDTDDVFQ